MTNLTQSPALAEAAQLADEALALRSRLNQRQAQLSQFKHNCYWHSRAWLAADRQQQRLESLLGQVNQRVNRRFEKWFVIATT